MLCASGAEWIVIDHPRNGEAGAHFKVHGFCYIISRIQVKTVGSTSIAFTGGIRGGVDREYRSDVKAYVQNTETSEVVVDVKSVRANGDTEIDFYFIPTIYIELLDQKSLSINKVPQMKNNWELLEKCKDQDFVLQTFVR